MQYLRDLFVRINNRFIKSKLVKTPFFNETTHKSETQWLEPVIVGKGSLRSKILSSENILESLEVLKKIPSDDYSKFLIGYYEKGIAKLDLDWQYADIITVLNAISRNFKLDSYLEIGVRNGRSLLTVSNNLPNCHIVGFDLWIEDYAGMENPGKDYVLDRLKEFNHQGKVEFIDGDSKNTVPKFFNDNPELFFDLITVDGDHRIKGAKTDIRNVIKRLKIGGFLVFDDIVSPHHPYLKKLWKKEISDNPQFSSFEFEDVGLGIGVAIRRH